MQRTEGTQRGTHLRQVQEEGRLPEYPPRGDFVDPLLVLLVLAVLAVMGVEMLSVGVGGGGGEAGEAGWVRQHEGLHHAALDEVHLMEARDTTMMMMGGTQTTSGATAAQ